MSKKNKIVTVEVTSQGAVYVDNYRITGRDTKWGIHHTLFSIKVKREDIVTALKEHGYGHIKLDAESVLEVMNG